MRKVWKGALIGGILGFILSLLLIKFGSSESVFHKPLDIILKLICNSSQCSDVTGFVMFSIFFTIIFYILVGVLIGVLIMRLVYKKTFVFLFLILFSIYSVQAYTYEYSYNNNDLSNLNSSIALKLENFTFNDSKFDKSGAPEFSAQYNNQWDNHLLDGPWKINENEDWIPLLVGVMKSDQELNDIYILDANDGDKAIAYTAWGNRVRTYPTPWFYLLYVNKSWFKQTNNQLAIKVRFDIYLDPFDNEEGPIYIKYNTEELPHINNWYCGDTHYHSEYTDTNFAGGVWGELGAPIEATLEVARVLDLDWLIVTDHSNSFNAHINNNKSWSNFKQDCNDYSNCLIGEEVNCRTPLSGNWLGNSLPGNHFLAYDINTGLLDNGQENVPYCSEIINNVSQQGGFGYVAHPESEMDYVVVDILMAWHNYSLPFKGLEIWNEEISNDLNEGLEKWKDILLGRNGLKSGRVFISAGSDAHGDLNSKFGKEYTCVYVSSYSKQNIFDGLEKGNSFISNNGALVFSINNTLIGNEINITKGNQVRLDISYNLESGCYLNISRGIINSNKESQIGSRQLINGDSNLFVYDSPTNNSYYRLECLNTNGDKRIYTNPIWVNVKECIPQWSCSSWSNCLCGTQNRTCIDLNSCGTNNNKPLEIQSCSYTPTWICGNWSECFNNLQQRTCSEINSCSSSYNETKNCSIPYLDLISPNASIYSSSRIALILNSNTILNKIEFIDNSQSRPRWTSLCSNCNNYNKTRSFNDGEHNLTFKGTLLNEQVVFNQTLFLIDSKEPQISTTKPSSRRYTNGSDFYIKYTEENCKSLGITISGQQGGGGADPCESGRNVEKFINQDLSSFDGQEIEYKFIVIDLANNSDESRPTKVNVDTTAPKIIKDDYSVIGNYLYLNISIEELNFDQVSYIDLKATRPRETRLCSSLKNGICYKKLYIRSGQPHQIKIEILDEAGNFIEKEVYSV